MKVYDASANLSRLLAEVQAGREIVITRAGRPVARLVPYDGAGDGRRAPGGWEGRVRIADDFDTLSAQVLDPFEGRAV